MKVSQALNEHMDGTGDGRRVADALWRSGLSDLESFFNELLRTCLQAVTAPEDFVGETRAVQFLGVMSQLTPTQPQGAMHVMDSLLIELTEWATTLEEPVMRTRAMMIIKEVLHGAEGRFSHAAMKAVLEPLMGAFNDKVAKIRKLAVLALNKVARSQDYGAQVMDAYIRQLELEANQAVRVAAAQSMPQREEAVHVMMERVRDVSPEVRAAVYSWFAAAPATALSVAQRVSLLCCGLRDRVPASKDAAVGMARSWLQQHCAGDVTRMLEAVEVQQNQGVAMELLEALAGTGALDCVQLLCSGAVGNLAHAAAGAQAAEAAEAAFAPTPPEQAFAWAFVARHLHATASAKGQAAARTTGAAAAAHAAAASDSHNLLEAFLPDSADQLASLVHAHALAGEQHAFAAAQILGIAGMAMDWTDGSSRSVATELIKGLIANDLRRGAPCAPRSPEGGDGLVLTEWAWQHAVVSFASRVLPDGRGLLGAVLPTLRAHVDNQVPVVATQGGLLQCLAYAAQLLQCLPKVHLPEECGGDSSLTECLQQQDEPRCPAASLQWLLEQLLLPCTGHADARVRSLAMQCMGVCPLLPLGKTTLLPAVQCALRLLSDAAVGVKEAAARALLNLILVYGVATINDKACKSGVHALQGGVSDLAGQLARADIHAQASTAPETGAAEAAPVPAAPEPASPPRQPPNFDCLQLLHSTLARAKRQRRLGQQQQPKGRRSRAAAAAEAAGVPEPQDRLICALVDGLARLALFQELHQVLQARQPGDGSSGAGAREQALRMAVTDEEAQLILDQLLCLYKDPAFEDIAHVQQLLGTFFEAYCKRAAGNKRRLAQALPNTLKRAMGIALKGHKTAAPGLAKFAAGLLLLPLNQQQQDQEQQEQQPEVDQGTEQLCLDLLQDLHAMPDNPSTAHKELYREMGAMLCHLPFNAAQHPEQLQCCLLLLRRCLSEGHLPTGDRALLKHLRAAQARFEAVQDHGSSRLSEAEMEALLQHAQQVLQVRRVVQQQQLAAEDGRGPGEEEEEEEDDEDEAGSSDVDSRQQTSVQSRKPRAPKRAPAARGRKATASSLRANGSDDSDGDDRDDAADSTAPSRDQTRAAAGRRQPVRGAAAKARQQLAASAAEDNAV